MIRGVSVSTQKRAQKLSCATWATEKGKAGGPDFQAQFDKSAGRPVEIRSFVTPNVIVRAVNREYLEAFQSPTTFANWEILRSSRFYFLLSKVVLAPKKEQEHPKH